VDASTRTRTHTHTLPLRLCPYLVCSFGTQRFQLKASNASSDQNLHSPDQLNGAYCYSDHYNPAELGHYVGQNLERLFALQKAPAEHGNGKYFYPPRSICAFVETTHGPRIKGKTWQTRFKQQIRIHSFRPVHFQDFSMSFQDLSRHS